MYAILGQMGKLYAVLEWISIELKRQELGRAMALGRGHTSNTGIAWKVSGRFVNKTFH